MREEGKSLCALVVKILLLSILLSCKTITNVVEAGGNVLNGSAFKKTKLELKRTPDKELEVRKILTTDGKTGLEIKFKQLPFVTFYGTDSDSAGRFNLIQMRYLAGNPGGWNEYYVQINGTGYYCPEGEESFVLDDIGGKSKISEGSIRRQDSRFYGNEAKDLLRSRALRITAVTDWMKEQEIQTDKKITTKTIFEKLQFEDKGEEKYGAEARSVPLVSFINPLFYNIDALKETGFDRPPKTREEFLDVSLSIMRTNKSIKPFIIGENIYTDIFPWIWSSGVDIKSIKENSSFDWTQKQIVDTLDFIKKLHYSRLLANDSFAGNAKDKLVNFAKGKIAMITAGAADIIKMPPELNFSVTTIPVPRGAFAKPVFNVSAWHAGVPLNSKHKKEAFVFLSYLNDNKQKLSEASGALPTYRESSGAEKIKNHQDVYSKMNDLQKASDIVFDNEIFVSCESLEAIIKEEITKMFIGNITAKECAAGIQERYLQCISNN
ncbi:hypothetical protein FACS189494_09010 [Spirochaetia bacterium]|nr:hypothetical protein FACS189494_09010 [Spirochaetia bacterium]